MPNWKDVFEEINGLSKDSPVDRVRKKYLKKLSNYTKRNVICYYSGFLQKNNISSNLVSMTDDDKNGFMQAIHGLNSDLGLDLIIHTPGGDIGALESIGDYLISKFGSNIRAIVPMMAMSAGTMLACCAKEIIMGKQSNLGPFDPQFNGYPAYGILEEVNRAKEEISKDPNLISFWQFPLNKLNPTIIGQCEKAIKWSTEIVSNWLINGMFCSDGNAEIAKAKADKICKSLNNHDTTFAHIRHIQAKRAKDIGLKIEDLEDDQKLQDLVLTVHHCYMQTFGSSNMTKIIENHNGNAMSWQTEII